MHGLEFPVCIFDLKTGVLCSKCEQKLRAGELTETDLQIMRFLVDAEKKIPQISSFVYFKSYKTSGYLFVFFLERSLSSSPANVVAELEKALSQKTGLKVKLLELRKDLNVFLQNLVAPARVLTVNKVWLPDQTTELRVLVDDEKSLTVSPAILSEVVKHVMNVSVSFEFQRKGRQPLTRPAR
ncbi:MAG: hypothetical protein RMI49_01445 [Candidatus Caldarchaeum sp.]|nr:hypothetical protein [Candidatus Caldarchaeum sp.]